MEEVEEAEAVEEVEEAEAVEEVEAVEEELEELEEAGPLDDIDEADGGDASGAIAELQPIAEIEALPPEPFEDLEYLPGDAESEAQPIAEGEGQDVAARGMLRTAEGLERPVRGPLRVSDFAILEPVEPIESIEPEKIAKSPKMQSFSIEEIMDRLTSGPIVQENGVFRVGEQAYNRPSQEGKEDLKQLADSVLGGPRGSASSRGARPMKELPILKEGFDFDHYLSQFPEPGNLRTQYKSLVEITKSVDAVCAAMLIEDKGRFWADLTLGLGEDSVETFQFAPEHAVVTGTFRKKRILVINQPVEKVDYLEERITEDDLKYMKRAMFLPCIFNNSDAVLFLAFAKDTDLDLDNVLSNLNISLQR